MIQQYAPWVYGWGFLVMVFAGASLGPRFKPGDGHRVFFILVAAALWPITVPAAIYSRCMEKP